MVASAHDELVRTLSTRTAPPTDVYVLQKQPCHDRTGVGAHLGTTGSHAQSAGDPIQGRTHLGMPIPSFTGALWAAGRRLASQACPPVRQICRVIQAALVHGALCSVVGRDGRCPTALPPQQARSPNRIPFGPRRAGKATVWPPVWTVPLLWRARYREWARGCRRVVAGSC